MVKSVYKQKQLINNSMYVAVVLYIYKTSI